MITSTDHVWITISCKWATVAQFSNHSCPPNPTQFCFIFSQVGRYDKTFRIIPKKLILGPTWDDVIRYVIKYDIFDDVISYRVQCLYIRYFSKALSLYTNLWKYEVKLNSRRRASHTWKLDFSHWRVIFFLFLHPRGLHVLWYDDVIKKYGSCGIHGKPLT